MTRVTNERWLPIEGHESYEVSDHGRIRSFAKTRAGRLRSLSTNSQGYITVDLWMGNSAKSYRVHRLVLSAFVGPQPEGMEGCHNDGDRTNNRLSNLRWDTRLENMADIGRHGRHPSSSKTSCPAGHPFDETNTYLSPRGGRGCKECRRASVRAHRAKQAKEST